MSRISNRPWLESYQQYTSNTEAPATFNIWVGLSTIASALQRKTYINFKGMHVTVYPNLFVVLCAPPGVCRKGTVINIGLELLRSLEGPKIIANDITREKILQDMKQAHRLESEFESVGHSSVTCVAEEFSTLLGFKNIELLATLTALFNCDSEYIYSTKTQGEDRIINPWINILAGTTPQWLQSSLPLEAIGGGFTSRIIFVVERKPGKRVALTDDIQDFPPELERTLIHDLGEIYKMSGEFARTKEANELYREWYLEFTSVQPSIPDERFLTYLSRKQIMVWKAAMLLSASASEDMVINETHVGTALQLLNDLEENMPMAFGGLGRSQIGSLVSLVREYIHSSPDGLTAEQLMQVAWMHIRDSTELSMVLSNLKMMQQIKDEVVPGRGLVYKPIIIRTPNLICDPELDD